jgi:leucine dehydrogenase
VINAGGVISITCEYVGDVDDVGAMDLIAQIGPRLSGIFQEAERTGEPTSVIADRQARRIIADAA